jgi:hypothetical protein
MCRETGMMVELSDVPVHSLVPEQLRSIASADEFMAALPQYDDQMAQQLDEATAAGDCLRFVGEAQLCTCHCQSKLGSVRCIKKMRLSALLRVVCDFGFVITPTASSPL